MGSWKLTDQGGNQAPFAQRKGEPLGKKYSNKTPVSHGDKIIRKMNTENSNF